MIKIWRSPYADFGHNAENVNDLLDETVTADATYDDECLAKIASSGFNGIWIHGLLHHIVRESVFPEFGENADVHQAKVNSLIKRAAKYGIKVYLYMQPPRALPVSNYEFWKNHQDIAGQVEEIAADDGSGVFKVQSLCTSTPQVQKYLKSAAGRLAELFPELGGVILITASEYPAHCIAKRGRVIGAAGEINFMPVDCPRCSIRKPEDIVAEIITLIRDGIRNASETIDVIAWNWSWSNYVDPPCGEIISQLPHDAIVMAGFERGGVKDILGHKNVKIDEYSLSYIGPSVQFKGAMDIAAKSGIKFFAKLQFGTTHELATVPSLPLIGNLFEKALFTKQHNLAGFMGCWSFGNMITANTAAFNWFLLPESPSEKDDALVRFAREYFSDCDADKVRQAWLTFADAMNNYPFCFSFLYAGPVNYALSFISYPAPLNKKSAGRSWLMDERGDDLSGAIDDFSLDEIIYIFSLIVDRWQEGVALLRQGLSGVNTTRTKEELANAEVCGAAFRSTRNLFSFYKLRLDWDENKISEFNKIAHDELMNIKYVLPLIESDERFGYHSEAKGYMYDANMLKNKIKEMENFLA